MVFTKIKAFFSYKQPVSFRKILSRYILIISLVSLGFLGMASIYVSYLDSYRQVSEGLKNSCRLASNTIQLYMNSILKTLDTISPYLVVTSSALEEKRLINNTLNKNPQTFLELTLLNEDGSVRQSTSFSHENIEKTHFENYFDQASQNQQVQISQAFFSEKYQEPCLLVITPILDRNRQNQQTNFLMALVSLRTVWNLFDEKSDTHIAYGDTGYAYLLDSDKVIVAHPSIEKALSKITGDWLPTVLFDERDQLSLYFDNTGRLVYGYASVIPSLDWYVVMEITLVELLMSIITTLIILFLLIVVVFVITMVLSKLFTTKLTNDLLYLQRFTSELAMGNLESQISRKSLIKEINELSDNFNVMSAQLKTTIDKLKLADRLAALGKMSAIVAHEIRNPLAGMKPYVQLFEQRVSAQDQRYIDGFVKVMPGEIERLESLVNNLLDYTKPVVIETETVEINGFIDSILTQLSLVFEQEKIQLVKHPETFEAEFYMDQDKIRQVIINIIMNSVQALKRQAVKRISLEVQLSHEVHTKRLEICLVDNGPGIPEEIQDRLFEPFTKARSGKGSGLGMSIASRIVEDHGGHLVLNETSSRGTSISIILFNSEKDENG